MFLFFFALCIDLVTDKVQPLSREFPNAVAQQRDSGRGLGGGAKVGLCGVQVCVHLTVLIAGTTWCPGHRMTEN